MYCLLFKGSYHKIREVQLLDHKPYVVGKTRKKKGETSEIIVYSCLKELLSETIKSKY